MKLKLVSQADGKVILLYDGTPDDVAKLKGIFTNLSLKENLQVYISQQSFIHQVSGCNLIAKSSSQVSGLWKENASDYLWTLPTEEWEWIVELVKPLERPWEASHQLLYHGKDVRIIISSGEGW